MYIHVHCTCVYCITVHCRIVKILFRGECVHVCVAMVVLHADSDR